MNKFLSQIRRIDNEISITRKIINTIFILCFGIVLGTFAKFLDTTASNTLPFIFEYLDISNFWSFCYMVIDCFVHCNL